MACVHDSWDIAGKPVLANQQKLLEMVDKAITIQLSSNDPNDTGTTVLTTSAKLVLSHDRLGAIDYDLGAIAASTFFHTKVKVEAHHDTS